MIPVFSPIDTNTWPRKPYFDYFYYGVKTKYNINYNLDITPLIKRIKEKELKFYPVMLYVIMKAVNRQEAFRYSFDANGVLGNWNYVNPSYTIFHEDDKTFSDVWSEYDEDFTIFYATIVRDINLYKDVKGLKARAGRPQNFCPVSALPWLSFAGFSQDTYTDSSLLFPIIRFGKYYTENAKTLLPLTVFVHHAVADGYHTCELINDIQALTGEPAAWLNEPTP